MPKARFTMIMNSDLRNAITCIEAVARDKAGISQAPYLITAKDTEEWALAKKLRRQLRMSIDAKAGSQS
jgi:hypothetical protein